MRNQTSSISIPILNSKQLCRGSNWNVGPQLQALRIPRPPSPFRLIAATRFLNLLARHFGFSPSSPVVESIGARDSNFLLDSRPEVLPPWSPNHFAELLAPGRGFNPAKVIHYSADMRGGGVRCRRQRLAQKGGATFGATDGKFWQKDEQESNCNCAGVIPTLGSELRTRGRANKVKASHETTTMNQQRVERTPQGGISEATESAAWKVEATEQTVTSSSRAYRCLTHVKPLKCCVTNSNRKRVHIWQSRCTLGKLFILCQRFSESVCGQEGFVSEIKYVTVSCLLASVWSLNAKFYQRDDQRDVGWDKSVIFY